MKYNIKNSFLLALMICICLIFKVEADAEELKPVTEVKLQLTTDAGGFTYEEFKNSLTILSEGVMFPTAEQAPDGWFGVYDEETGAWANVIEAGKSYRMDIFLSPKEGYRFIESSTLHSCVLNGTGQGFQGWGGGTASHRVDYSISEQFIYISVENYKIDKWIESAEFLLADYKVGTYPNYDIVTTTTEHIKVEGEMILYSDLTSLDQELKPHTEYMILIAFLPDTGYSVSKLQKENIKVMGKEPKRFEKFESGYYYVECDLDILHDGGVANCHTPKICDICQEPYGEKEPENHDGEIEIKDQKQATCKETGYSGDTYCLSCENLISSGTVTPLSEEHAYDEGVITISPTEIGTGIKTYTCTRCQKTKTEEIPKLEVKDEPKEDGTKGNGSNESGSKEDGLKEDISKGESKKEKGDKDTGIPAKNTTIRDSKTGMKYRVTKAGKTGGSVEFLAPKNKKLKQITIPATVKIGGISYKVTSIAKNAFKGCKKLKKVVIGKNITKIGSKAFYGCKNLKTIIIKTTKLKSSKVGEKAFTGTAKKAKVTVPKKSYKKYKKFLYKKGINKKAKIKKASK